MTSVNKPYPRVLICRFVLKGILKLVITVYVKLLKLRVFSSDGETESRLLKIARVVGRRVVELTGANIIF